MKRILTIVALSLITTILYAQKKADTTQYEHVPGTSTFIKRSDSSKYYKYDGVTIFDIRKATPQQLARIKERQRLASIAGDRYYHVFLNAATTKFPRNSLAVRFEQNTAAILYRGKGWMWGTLFKENVMIGGPASIEIADVLITPKNAANYRYRIIQNDNKELVGWSVPTIFKSTADKKYTYASLGKISYEPNQVIQVEIYNIYDYRDRDAMMFDWRTARKLNAEIFLQYRTSNNPTIFSVSLGHLKKKMERFVNFIETENLKHVKFRLSDSLVRIAFYSQNLPTAYNYQMVLNKKVDGKIIKNELGEFNKSFDLYKAFWDTPGQYEMVFTPVLEGFSGEKSYLNSKALHYTFTVLPPLNAPKLFSSKQIALIGVLLCAIFGAFLGIIVTRLKQRNQQDLNREQQQKEIARTQLSGIRAQLNPHFIFNALAGIQNLMNKNETDTANRYLGKFARVTRNVLNSKELITLKDERELLEDYLQMEQLRFGFNYSIQMDDDLDSNNIEIPVMLLQPFVENSVKHGISGVQKGVINISFLKREKDLALSLEDNGRGFDTELKYDGFGLQLSKNRVSLLNSIYPDNKIFLNITADNAGTSVTIILTQWL